MPKRDRQHAATSDRIAALPCFDGQGVTVQTTGEVTKELSLGEGRTNQNFIVTTGDATKYFVRVGGDLPHHAVVRDRERAVQRAAAAQGLAPEVVYASDDIMVMSFVNGKALTEAQALAAESVAYSKAMSAESADSAAPLTVLGCWRDLAVVRRLSEELEEE